MTGVIWSSSVGTNYYYSHQHYVLHPSPWVHRITWLIFIFLVPRKIRNVDSFSECRCLLSIDLPLVFSHSGEHWHLPEELVCSNALVIITHWKKINVAFLLLVERCIFARRHTPDIIWTEIDFQILSSFDIFVFSGFLCMSVLIITLDSTGEYDISTLPSVWGEPNSSSVQSNHYPHKLLLNLF